MLRQGNTRPLHWADKTMSVMRAEQLEACEKDLASLPVHGLFDASCGDADAELLYEFSYYAAEDRAVSAPPVLHTVDDLRVRVLSSMAAESVLLSPEEHDLLVRLALFGGRHTLQDWNDLIPARSLLRRLWCRAEWDDGALTILMPHQLCATALILLAGDEHRRLRDSVEKVHELIDNTLYLMGMMQAAGPILHLKALLKDTFAAGRTDLVLRMLQAAYDYVFDREGHMLLIHPGLADPDRMITQMDFFIHTPEYERMNPEALSSASDSVSDLESPLYERMLFTIADATRPELTPEDAVEDLIILAKQGVPLQDMKEVLSSMLVSLPTADMLKALEDISAGIPRWLYLSSSRVQ